MKQIKSSLWVVMVCCCFSLVPLNTKKVENRVSKNALIQNKIDKISKKPNVTVKFNTVSLCAQVIVDRTPSLRLPIYNSSDRRAHTESVRRSSLGL